MSDWISVKERLPERRADVLVVAGGEQVVAHWSGRDSRPEWILSRACQRCDWDIRPTHWMPLPAPPEGE